MTRLRSFGEEMTKTIYKEESLPRFPQATFYELTKNPVFADCVDKSLIHQLNFLRVQGNDSAHGAEGDLQSAKMSLSTAHQLAGYMALTYGGEPKENLPPLKEVPDPVNAIAQLKKSVSSYKKDIEKQQEELERVMVELDRSAPSKPNRTSRRLDQNSKRVKNAARRRPTLFNGTKPKPVPS